MFSTAGREHPLFGRLFVIFVFCCVTTGVRGAPPEASLFRIFLADGSSLISYGEFARVADRVVFSVPLGEGEHMKLQLVSIPEGRVDWTRTHEYAATVRAKRYAETRGETDFALLTGQVSAALGDISRTADPKRRVAMAEEARHNLAAWPAANYGYRASDVAQLVGMLDDVVAEMRVAAGETQFDLSLVATSTPPPPVPLLPPPDARASLEAAYHAALAATDPGDRLALLRMLTSELEFAPAAATWAPVLRASAAAALASELRIENAYADLVKRTLTRATERARRGDVRGLQQLVARALSGDTRLGAKRPGEMASLLAALDLRLDEARRLRLARDSWAARATAFREYRDDVQKPRERVAGLRKWLGHIRDLSGPDPGVLRKLEDHASRAQREFAAITPPPELEPAHGLFVASVHMIRQAASLRRSALTSKNLKLAWDASSAAAGALLLAERGTDELNRLLSESFQSPR